MDLNHLLIWLVGVSTFTGTLTLAVRSRGRAKNWMFVLASIMFLLGVAWWLVPEVAGFIGAAVWLLVFLLPALGQGLILRRVAHCHFATAAKIARVMAVLHPTKVSRAQPAYLDVLAQIHRGDTACVEALAGRGDVPTREGEATPGRDDRLARFAKLQLYRLRGQWPQTRQFLGTLSAEQIATDPQAMVSYVRCLGELGEPEAMLQVFRRVGIGTLGQLHNQMVLFVLALTGNPKAVARLFDGLLRFYPTRARNYWVATALQAAGNIEAAKTLLQPLADVEDTSLRLASGRRLARPLAEVTKAQLSDESRSLIARISQQVDDVATYGSLGAPPKRGSTFATWTIMAVLSVVILIEIPGGATDQENLYRLGALVISSDPNLIAGSWWRVITAAFLHFGVTHYAANLFGLFFLGRYFERMWGATGLFACYLLAAIGANTAATYLLVPQSGVGFVVGASGGVMGIVGGLVALLVVEWRRTRKRLLLRQLSLLGLVLMFQIVFDLSTPNVSSTIHLSGAFIGLITGFVLVSLRRNT